VAGLLRVERPSWPNGNLRDGKPEALSNTARGGDRLDLSTIR
jgi:hypothetical protein